MRTAIRDVAEGMDMGLETGSVPGFSCSLYGGVDFEEDYREVTGWSEKKQYRRTWIWAKPPVHAMQREQESLHHSRSPFSCRIPT